LKHANVHYLLSRPTQQVKKIKIKVRQTAITGYHTDWMCSIAL
jgi:hypothetical protein